MQLFLLLLSALALASACTSTPPLKPAWTRPEATLGDLDAAREACLSDPGVLQSQEPSERINARLAGNRFVDCMEARGWKRTSAQ